MADAFAELLIDLAAEHHALDDVVAPLTDEQWEVATPATDWAVRDQIWHLCYFDGKATLAATDPDSFSAHLETVINDPKEWGDQITGEGRSQSPQELLDRWRTGRAEL